MSTEDQLEEAQAWAEWFAAERDEVIEELEASQRAHILAVRAHSASLKLDKARYDDVCATVDRVRKLVNGAQTDALVSICVMHGGKPFPAMVSVDSVIDALDGGARA